MLKKISMAACAAITLSAATQAMAVPITYQGSLTVRGETGNFSITTDGTVGKALALANIIDYNFTISNSIETISGSMGHGGKLTITGDGLTASATQLSFNYGVQDLFEFSSTSQFAFIAYMNYQGLTIKEVDHYPFPDGGGLLYGSDFSGPLVQVVANAVVAPTPPAVPEPATWGMMVVGFGAMGVVARRRRARGSVACA